MQGHRAIAGAAWQATFLNGRIRLIRRNVALYRIRSSYARGGRVAMSVHVTSYATSKLEGVRSVAAGDRSSLVARPVALTLHVGLRPEHQPLIVHDIARRAARSST